MILKPPCLDCPDRYPACHDHCDRYGAFREAKLKEYEKRDKERLSDPGIFLIGQMTKQKRKK